MSTATAFRNREDAGSRLAEALSGYADARPVVLGLPRGGVPLADAVAERLGAPLDVLVVRKLGVPGSPELGFGAVGEQGVTVINEDLCHRLGLADDEIRGIARRERAEVERRATAYRDSRPMLSVAGRSVIVVDDGLATGSTAAAAVHVLRQSGAERVILAVPVGSRQAVAKLSALADEVVCLESPSDFRSVGEHYGDFSQETDEGVREYLRGGVDIDVRIPLPHNGSGVRHLPGRLTVPPGARGLVAFAHGSGSSRLSPRNQQVAEFLNAGRLGTLLFDLMLPEEESDRRLVFDVEFLARRVQEALLWCEAHPRLEGMRVGLFGASTGAAAALVAAALQPSLVGAVVSRGGRPDLAEGWLPRVSAPTLLIVGSYDVEVARLNRWAQQAMHCVTRLAVVQGAGHLFEEPGAMDRVADMAREWFIAHLAISDGD